LPEEEYVDVDDDLTGRPRHRAKLCLVGDAGVGKTSLIRRFVVDQFDSKYIKTIGTKVSKKTVLVHEDTRRRDVEVIMTIWDIMGQEGFRELLKDAYFSGANGILAVCDVVNVDSMNKLDGWLDRTFRVAGEVPVSILVNKVDLKDKDKTDTQSLEQFSKAYACPYIFTSAKTGENVQSTFMDLADRILKSEMSERFSKVTITV